MKVTFAQQRRGAEHEKARATLRYEQQLQRCEAVPIYRWPMVLYASGPFDVDAAYLGVSLHYNPILQTYALGLMIEVPRQEDNGPIVEMLSLIHKIPETHDLTQAIMAGDDYHQSELPRFARKSKVHPRFKAAPTFNDSLQRYQREVSD